MTTNSTILRKRDVRKRMRTKAATATRIADAFTTVKDLVAAIEDDESLQSVDGIGPKTEEIILDWWDNRFERESNVSETDIKRTSSKAISVYNLASWSDALEQT